MRQGLVFLGVELAVILIIVAVFLLWLFTPVFAAERQCGIASQYGQETCRPGRPCRTAHGDPFPSSAPTAAHRTLPFGTRVRVTMPSGDGCTVIINDRGPFVRDRIIDLSPAAAQACGLNGLARVCIATGPQARLRRPPS